MKMKTAFAVLLATVMLCITAVIAGAAGTYRKALERYPSGDTDHDGIVSSNDARCILRISVGLDDPDRFELLMSDANGDGAINSSDARQSLRTSVGIEEAHFHHFTAVIPGSNVFTCDGCGYSFTDEKCEHKFVLSVVAEQPSCRGGSVKTYICMLCGDTKEETLPKTSDHVYGSGVTVKKATCRENGIKTYTCNVCGDVKTEAIPKTNAHSFDDGKLTRAATCKNTGIMTYTCTVCGTTKTKNTERLTAHSFGEGKVTVPATCTEKGVLTYTCTVCGAARTEEIKATGHSFDTLTDGIRHCTLCGYALIANGAEPNYVSIGGKIAYLGEELSALQKDFGKYTRSDNVFQGVVSYSFAADYENYFIAFFDEGKAVGYYVCAADFSCAVYSKGDKTTVTVKRIANGTIRLMPFIDRAHDSGIYALMIANEEYTFTPDFNNQAFFAQASKQIFDMTNAYRAQFGKTALQWNDNIARVTQKHSADMAENNYLEHRNASGQMPWNRAAAAGIDYVYYAENIAGGSGISYMTFDQWVNSKSHNDNLLADCTQLGVGGAYSAKAQFGFYWTQNFAQLG